VRRHPLLPVLLTVIVSCSSLCVRAQSPPQNGQIATIERQLDSGEYDQAIEQINHLMSATAKPSEELYRMLAFAQYKQGNKEDALKTSETGLAHYPASQPIGALFMVVFHEVVPPQEQHAKLEELLQQVSQSPTYLKAHGQAVMATDSASPQALKDFSLAAKLSPADPEAHFLYGESACFNKQELLCIRELTRAHQLSPGNHYADMQIYTMMAVAQDQLRHTPEASEDFARALEANRQLPQPNPYSALKYVNFLVLQGKREEAAQVNRQILEWDPAYGPALFEQAKMLAAEGKQQEAAAEAERALADSRSEPADVRAYHAFLARTYFALGRQDDAQAQQAWIEAHPDANSNQ
jgi:tetratricopeptide (TPR) repeat protein